MNGVKVAVLNHDFSPNNFTSWKRAIVLLEKGRVEVVKYSDTVVKTSSRIIKVPAIVKLVRVIKEVYKRVVRFSKHNLLIRDKNKCMYCGKEFGNSPHKIKATIDHVLPRSRGGRTNWKNCVCACKECNEKKADRLPHEAGLVLKVKPTAPNIVVFQQMKLRNTFNLDLKDLFAEMV